MVIVLQMCEKIVLKFESASYIYNNGNSAFNYWAQSITLLKLDCLPSHFAKTYFYVLGSYIRRLLGCGYVKIELHIYFQFHSPE